MKIGQQTSTATLEHAQLLLQRGQWHEAEQVCRAVLGAHPQSVEGWHLLGLVRERHGAHAEAESLLRRSVTAAPQCAEFRLNLGNFFRRAGRLREARAEYEALLATRPDFRLGRLALMRLCGEMEEATAAETLARELIKADVQDAEAWHGLAVALRIQRKPLEAESAYRQALRIQPRYAVARHNLGALLCEERRAAEALAEIEQAARDGAAGPELLFNRARALIELQRFAEAESDLQQVVARAPVYLEGQMALAQLRFCRGDPNFARDMLAAATRYREHEGLQIAVGQVLRACGDLNGAQRWLEQTLLHAGAAPGVRAELAGLLQERGDVERARAMALEALRLQPRSRAAAVAAASSLLGAGEAGEALALADEVLAKAPFDQLFIAYRASALRLLNDPRYGQLYDYEHLVRAYTIETPEGWRDLASFLNDLRATLEDLHTLQRQPLDQSLRHGTQSAHSLLAESAPAIRALLAAFREPLASYQASIGACDSHPLRARNVAPAVLSGCWSVRLARGGHHVNHVHPEGWLSSAFYVDVPAETADATSRNGWLKFGEPRFPFPAATAEEYVQPLPGRLVLFPSYMWHGTTALGGSGPRLTVAFDAVPGCKSNTQH